MIDKTLLTGAFEKMGPERVERMLSAFGPKGCQISYCRCALGFAGGFDALTGAQLGAEMRATSRGLFNTDDILEWFAHRLNISVEQADAIEECHALSARWAWFVALANEWLENRPASLRASRETAGVGECR